jgi:hypothetical protein
VTPSAVVTMLQPITGRDVFSGRYRALGASLVMIFRKWLKRLRALRESAKREIVELERVPAVTYVQEVGRTTQPCTSAPRWRR